MPGHPTPVPWLDRGSSPPPPFHPYKYQGRDTHRGDGFFGREDLGWMRETEGGNRGGFEKIGDTVTGWTI